MANVVAQLNAALTGRYRLERELGAIVRESNVNDWKSEHPLRLFHGRGEALQLSLCPLPPYSAEPEQRHAGGHLDRPREVGAPGRRRHAPTRRLARRDRDGLSYGAEPLVPRLDGVPPGREAQ